MQNTSAEYRHILADANAWFETKVTINGEDYAEDQIFSLSTYTAMFDSDPEIGHAIAAEVDLKIIKPKRDFPTMAEIIPWVRASLDEEQPSPVSFDGNYVDFGEAGELDGDILILNNAYTVRDIVYFSSTTTRLSSEWLQKGVFYIDTRESTKNSNGLEVLEIHGYDAMLKADQDYASTNLAWPAVDTAVVAEIAGKMGVEVDARTWAIMTDRNMINLPSAFTLRETLGFIASMYVGSFIMTDIGKLRLVTLTELPPETNLLIAETGSRIIFGQDRILV